MPEADNRFRGALVRAAHWKMAGAFAAGAGLAVGFLSDTYLGFSQGAPADAVCAQSAALGVSIAIVFLWSFRSSAEAREGDAPLTAMAAHRLWGRAAGGDAIGLLPWGVLVCASFHRFGSSLPAWAIAVLAGLVACVAVHLVLLPRRLRKDLVGWTPTENESAYGAPASDPIRVALARLAGWKVLGALLGLVAIAFPWVYAEALPLIAPGPYPNEAWAGPMSGWELLLGRGSPAASVFSWLYLAGVLVLLCVGWWERRRARWPVAIRLLRARVLGGWILTLVPTVPALVLWLGAIGAFGRAWPLLAGAWISMLGLLVCAAGALLLPPLLLRDADRARARECFDSSGRAPAEEGSR